MTDPRPFVNLQEARRTGEDKFGRIRLTGGPCTNCNKGGVVCVHYLGRIDIGPIQVGDTILKSVRDGYLGINCGCYAKFHRQVAHILDKMGKS